MKRLLELSAFDVVLDGIEGPVAVVDGIGNIGDQMIYKATRLLLREHGIKYQVVNVLAGDSPTKEIKHVLLFGGGNMGYGPCIEIRKMAAEFGLPMTVLPQTWRLYENGPWGRVFAREHMSIAMFPRAQFCPDLALAIEFPEPRDPVTESGLFCQRFGDGLFADYPASSDPAEYCHTVDQYIDMAQRYEHIVTDRVHFAICGLGLHRKVTLLPCAYHKNRSIWESSLKDLGCQWADHPQEVGYGVR